MNSVPIEVLALLEAGDGWIVGSAARPEADLKKVRDFDVVIPLGNWNRVGPLMRMMETSANVEMNSFGGWKFTFFAADDSNHPLVVDVWPDFIERLLERTDYFWWPHKGLRMEVSR